MDDSWNEPAPGETPDDADDGATPAERLSHELREVGLVALQAAVLTRRIYLPASRPGEPSAEQWQVLLALTLIDDSAGTRPAASLGAIARLLTLTPEDARDCLAALIDSGHVTAARDVAAEDRGERLRWTPTPRGRAAAKAYLERAGRFLPGWPPR